MANASVVCSETLLRMVRVRGGWRLAATALWLPVPRLPLPAARPAHRPAPPRAPPCSTKPLWQSQIAPARNGKLYRQHLLYYPSRYVNSQESARLNCRTRAPRPRRSSTPHASTCSTLRFRTSESPHPTHYPMIHQDCILLLYTSPHWAANNLNDIAITSCFYIQIQPTDLPDRWFRTALILCCHFLPANHATRAN